MPVEESERLVSDWATRLGLAQTDLFERKRDPQRQHYALLDGVEGSFALSTIEVDERSGLDWAWSAQLSSHVQVLDEFVILREVNPQAPSLRFKREQVGRNLDKFFETVVANRVAPAMTISDHVVGCFRAHRQVAARCGLTDEEGLATFLALIDDIIAQKEGGAPSDERLPGDHGDRFREELRYNRLTRRSADLGLTMRHAAGMVFQETHAELSTEPLQPQLFGLTPAPKRSTRNRLGAYYTPAGLARILSDAAVAPHLEKPRICILDPACGSGTFLSEVLRSLQRRHYQGQIELIGYDVSDSAIEMARFALRHNDAAAEAQIIVEPLDFLAFEGRVDADVVLMNPPFVAFQDQSKEHREKAKEVLGDVFGYRPDLSMLFITLGLSQLREGGTLASLLPAGVLEQTNGSKWRSRIVEANNLDLVAVLGDHGLFRDAIVNIAAIVLGKTAPIEPVAPTMLWASQKRGASASALRRLRRWAGGNRRPEKTTDWSIYTAPTSIITERDDWMPRPNTLGDLPERLRSTNGIATATKLFQVELGVRAGTIGEKFRVSVSTFEKLPDREKKLFRPVAETKSIRGGKILPISYIFYPECPVTPTEIQREAPKFYGNCLAGLDLDPEIPIDLERARRKTNDARCPKVVSRAFIGTESFAVDPTGEHVVVQGYSWLPKAPITDGPFDLIELMTDYCFVLNSRHFFMLLRENGRIVSGGQIDGAKRHMRHVPLPDLAALYLETPALMARAAALRRIGQREYPRSSDLDEFAAAAYRTNKEEWTLPG